MSFLNVGNHGWLIDGENEISEQQEKEEAVAYATERLLSALKEVSRIYSEFGDAEAFTTFQGRVNEAMKQADLRGYFNKENE